MPAALHRQDGLSRSGAAEGDELAVAAHTVERLDLFVRQGEQLGLGVANDVAQQTTYRDGGGQRGAKERSLGRVRAASRLPVVEHLRNRRGRVVKIGPVDDDGARRVGTEPSEVAGDVRENDGVDDRDLARDRRLSVHQVLQQRVLGAASLVERVLDRVSLVSGVRREPGAVDHFDAATFDLQDEDSAVSVEDDEVGLAVALAIRSDALPRDRVQRQAMGRVELLQGRDDLELRLG